MYKLQFNFLTFLCMQWIHLTDEAQLNDIISRSAEKPQVIFKHSTRCSISSVAFQRLQKSAQPDGIEFYYLDLLAHRPLSNKVSELLRVHHESPQVLVVRNGKCIYDESHLAISMADIVESAQVA
jgi:bacillithiol system protein YtxJ